MNDEEAQDFKLLINEGVYCGQCNDICRKGVSDYTITLDTRNDIVIRGACKVCGASVCRVMEFGESRMFFEKAIEFRKSIQN